MKFEQLQKDFSIQNMNDFLKKHPGDCYNFQDLTKIQSITENYIEQSKYNIFHSKKINNQLSKFLSDQMNFFRIYNRNCFPFQDKYLKLNTDLRDNSDPQKRSEYEILVNDLNKALDQIDTSYTELLKLCKKVLHN